MIARVLLAIFLGCLPAAAILIGAYGYRRRKRRIEINAWETPSPAELPKGPADDDWRGV